MQCPKCGGAVVYDPARWQGDAESRKCLNCGDRLWLDAKIVMPGVPQKTAMEQNMSRPKKGGKSSGKRNG